MQCPIEAYQKKIKEIHDQYVQEHMFYLALMLSDQWQIIKYFWCPFSLLKGNDIDG